MLVLLIIVIILGGYRRWWVWGWMYDREVERANTADTQAERNAEALEKQTHSLASQAQSYEVMARSYDRLDPFTDGPTRRRSPRG